MWNIWSFGTWTYHNLIIEKCRSQSLVFIFNILLYVKLIKIEGVFLAGCTIATLYLMTTFQTLKTTTCIIILQFICSPMAGHLCDANVVSLCDKQSWMVVVCWTINVNTCTVAVVGNVLETIANCLKQKLHLKVCSVQLVNIFHPVHFVPNMSAHLGS